VHAEHLAELLLGHSTRVKPSDLINLAVRQSRIRMRVATGSRTVANMLSRNSQPPVEPHMTSPTERGAARDLGIDRLDRRAVHHHPRNTFVCFVAVSVPFDLVAAAVVTFRFSSDGGDVTAIPLDCKLRCAHLGKGGDQRVAALYCGTHPHFTQAGLSMNL